MLQNQPCLLARKFVTHWPCVQKWVLSSGDVDWDYIGQTYGDHEVTVADCRTRDFSDQKREEMKLSDAVDKLRPPVGESSPLLYIKDWHLVLQSTNLPERDDRLPYETLDLFEDDCKLLVL